MKHATIANERIAHLKEDFERGFIRFCGYKALDVQWGKFTSELTIREDHRQQDGFIHAGVMATMADHTAGYSAFTIVPEEYQILTIEFKINFLRPACGSKLECHSKIIRHGRQIIIAESEVIDFRSENEVHSAKAMVTLMAVHRDKLKAK